MSEPTMGFFAFGRNMTEKEVEEYGRIQDKLFKKIECLKCKASLLELDALRAEITPLEEENTALCKELYSANKVINGIRKGQVDMKTMDAVIVHRDKYPAALSEQENE